MIKLQESHKGYKPIAFVNSRLVCYSKGQLWIGNEGAFIPLLNLQDAQWKDRTRTLCRLFRREPKHAAVISGNRLLIAHQKKLVLADVANRTATVVAPSRDGFSDPLNICTECDPWLAVWGDYGPNHEKQEIYVYGLKVDLSVEVIYKFPAGTIRHIHNIVPRSGEGFYILTGDTEETSGIYLVDKEFQNVKAVKTGNQQYRAVIAFDTDQGLLYATDSVNEPNHLYLLKKDGLVDEIAALNGSCIYGTKFDGDFYFSTTVEPDESNRGLTSWISNKRGKGILSNKVTLVRVNSKFQVETILSFEKDHLSMKLMQYGSIQFPHGVSDELWIYPVAVKKYDGTAIRLEADHE